MEFRAFLTHANQVWDTKSGLTSKVVDNSIVFQEVFPASFTKGILIPQFTSFEWAVHQSTNYTCSVAFRVSSRTGGYSKYMLETRLDGCQKKKKMYSINLHTNLTPQTCGLALPWLKINVELGTNPVLLTLLATVFVGTLRQLTCPWLYVKEGGLWILEQTS